MGAAEQPDISELIQSNEKLFVAMAENYRRLFNEHRIKLDEGFYEQAAAGQKISQGGLLVSCKLIENETNITLDQIKKLRSIMDFGGLDAQEKKLSLLQEIREQVLTLMSKKALINNDTTETEKILHRSKYSEYKKNYVLVTVSKLIDFNKEFNIPEIAALSKELLVCKEHGLKIDADFFSIAKEAVQNNVWQYNCALDNKSNDVNKTVHKEKTEKLFDLMGIVQRAEKLICGDNSLHHSVEGKNYIYR